MDQDAPDILLPRRRPAQQRSRERFNRILASARAVLVDVGFESFTFDEVARRAEVPIGTLYQFFANKYVLICELDRQDTAEIVSELQDFSSRVPALQWPDFLDEFIDHLAGLWRDDPSRRAVWHAVQSTPATRATAAATEQEMLDLIARVMKPSPPARPIFSAASSPGFWCTPSARYSTTPFAIKSLTTPASPAPSPKSSACWLHICSL